MTKRASHSIRIPAGSSLFCGLVGLAVASFFTANVRASCGDYLHVANRSQSDVTHSIGSKMPGSGMQGSETLPSADFPSERSPTGCRGPNCRRQVPAPMPQAPVPDSFGADKVLIESLADAMALPNASQYWLDMTDESPMGGHPFRLKRPPRS
jgi:hypothetical protein